jgi:hypothetical protein
MAFLFGKSSVPIVSQIILNATEKSASNGKEEAKDTIDVPAASRPTRSMVKSQFAGSTIGLLGKEQSKGTSQSRGDGQLFNMNGLPPRMKVPKLDNAPYRILQMVNIGSITSSASLAVFNGVVFSLSQVDQVSSLIAVFDQYRITEIEVWYMPRTSSTSVTGTGNAGLLASVLDYDDGTALTSFASALDYTNALVSSGVDGHYRRFKPHCAVAAYSGAFTSYANVESPWLDAVSTTVQHYGVKTAWTVTDTAYTQDILARFHVEFRNVR